MHFDEVTVFIKELLEKAELQNGEPDGNRHNRKRYKGGELRIAAEEDPVAPHIEAINRTTPWFSGELILAKTPVTFREEQGGQQTYHIYPDRTLLEGIAKTYWEDARRGLHKIGTIRSAPQITQLDARRILEKCQGDTWVGGTPLRPMWSVLAYDLEGAIGHSSMVEKLGSLAMSWKNSKDVDDDKGAKEPTIVLDLQRLEALAGKTLRQGPPAAAR